MATEDKASLQEPTTNEAREDVHLEAEEEKTVTKQRTQNLHRRRKYWIFCAVMTVILVAIAIPIGIFVILPMVAQLILDASSMSFNSIQITEPTNTNLKMAMDGALGNTGPFPATIKFPEPIDVYYNDQHLGSMNLPDTKASGGSGSLIASSLFTINNADAFGNFAADMMNKPTFVWTLRSKITLETLGMTIKDLQLNKELELDGMGGFPDVRILNFDLPSDAAGGQGINMAIDTAMNNPSPIGVTLGTVLLSISTGNTTLGQVKATGASLFGKSESILNLTGIMVPQTTPEDLAAVSSVFSSYIAGKAAPTTARGVSVLPDGVNEVSWLSSGFKALALKVALQAPEPLNVIKGIELGAMGMNWTNTDEYAPMAKAPGVVAAFEMPFGFSLNLTQIQNNMTVIYNNKSMAALNAAEWGPALTTKNAASPGSSIQFVLPPTPFAIHNDSHADFDDFVLQLTVGTTQPFTVAGVASTVALSPIGELHITGIPFKSDVALAGLQGLKAQPAVIHNLTVIGGMPAGLQIALNLTLFNPSLLSINTGLGERGIVTFNMVYQGDDVGTVIFPHLDLVPGVNFLQVGALFTPSGTAGGQALLHNYMTNQPSIVDIVATSSASGIAPLANGLAQVHLKPTMPGNPAQLLLGASLTILDNTGETGLAMASVTINNPFIPALTIRSIKASVMYNGRQLGLMVDQGKANNLTIAPITALSQLSKDPTVKIASSIFTGFNLPNFVQAAMIGLKVDVSLEVNVLVGEYATSLSLVQKSVPTATDPTILKLLPIVGTPIAQSIVDLATLTFSKVMILSPAETDFSINVEGHVANTGPFDSEISFPGGLEAFWLYEGTEATIGQLVFPVIPAKADVGAVLALTNIPYHVTSAENMGDFVIYALKSETMDWSVVANNITVSAMGTAFPNIHLKKTVSLRGFNKLEGLVIEKYDLPSNDPNGIHLSIAASLPNPSTVGIELGVAEFDVVKGEELGFIKAAALTLLPLSITPVQMEGTLTKQTTEAGLAALGDVFRAVLNGGSPSLIVRGKGATPPRGPVSWLTRAIKTLTMNVTLPSIGKQDIITGITLNTMVLDFTGPDPYSVLTSSDNIEASYHIPFTVPLNIVQVAEDMSIQLPKGNDVAHLKLPLGASQTISPGVLKTAYSNQPLGVEGSQHENFNAFAKILTTGPGVTFDLNGTADTVVETAAGIVTIPGIAVSVPSTLVGMNLNAGGAAIANVSVTGGTPEFAEIGLNVILQNPSGLTAKVGEVGFNIVYAGHAMGRAMISNMVLNPGSNILPAVFHLMPDTEAIRDSFLSGFVTGASFMLDVGGSMESSPIASLKDAMASVHLSAGITGITDHLIAAGSAAQADLIEMLQLLHERRTPAQVSIYNPFDTPLFIKRIVANTLWDGKQFGSIDQDLGLTVPPRSTALSPSVSIVSPAGLGFLTSTIVPFMLANPTLILGATVGVPFNVQATIVASIGGPNGYVGNVQYSQDNTMIQVSVQGKAPLGIVPALLAPLFPAPEPPKPAPAPPAPPVAPPAAPATAPSPPAPIPVESPAQSTNSNTDSTANSNTDMSPSPKATLTKRQIDILQAAPSSQDPIVIEAWLKAIVNNLALDQGVAPPFI
ncbi:hypothetical protein BGZ94_005885 [Podila epigama]|nr:hypothetical protein BGZ94_005885 [Podila epigama]